MNGPWEDYAPQQAPQGQPAPQQAAQPGPWEDYAQAAPAPAPPPPMAQPVQRVAAALPPPRPAPRQVPTLPAQSDAYTPFADAAAADRAFSTGVVPQAAPPPPARLHSVPSRLTAKGPPRLAAPAPVAAPPATAPKQAFDLGDYVSQELQRGFGQPWEKLQQDAGDLFGSTPAQVKAENANLPLWRKIVPMADPMGQRVGSVLGDAFGVATSPLNTAVHAAIVRPAASAATNYIGGDQANNEAIANTALMGLGPRTGVPAPVLPPDAALLAGEGVRLTPGMSHPGLMRKVEDTLSKIPLVGAKVSGEQKAAVGDLNLAAGNRTLAPIGETLPADMKPGRQMIAHIDDRISNAYQNTLPQLTVAADPQFVQGLQAAKAAPRFLAPEHQKYVNQVAKSLQDTLANPLDGVAWKQIDSQLGKAAADANTNNTLASALRDLQDEWRQVAYRSNSPVASQVRDIDRAYQMAGAVRRAATYKTKDGLEELGTFTPAQLDQAIKASDLGGKRSYATGSAPMQDLSDAATRVIGNPKGAPGWAHGGGGAIGTAAALWLEHNGFHIPPELMAAGLATMVPYTKTGRAIGGALARQPGVPLALGAATAPPLNARNY